MPELPEVEVIAQRLRDCVLGETIVHAEVRWARSVATPSVEAFERQVVGLTIRAVRRRGKFVLLDLPPKSLIVHLRMTGRLLYCEDADAEARDHPHVRVLLGLGSSSWLLFRDMRKFGRLYLVDDPASIVADLGPEPLAPSFSVDALRAILSRKRQLKPLLLDQHALAGLGNIYVDEALWLAGIHPRRKASTIASGEATRLHTAIRAVLAQAIAHNGTTFRDFRDPANVKGRNQLRLAVYHRHGQPCERCGATLIRERVGGRGTHLCPVCQQIDEPPSQCERSGHA